MSYERFKNKFICANNVLGRTAVFVLVGLFFSLFSAESCGAKSLRVVEYYHTLHQRFYCTVDYDPTDCVRHLGLLQQLLNQYHAQNLGEWRWVLVSKTRWKPDLLELGFHTTSPALTSFRDRETLVDESLFSGDAERVSELEHEYHVPWQRLLLLAITHELGHAICRDSNEIRAELFAERLRSGQSASCLPADWEPLSDFGGKALLGDINKAMLRRALQGGPK